MVLSSTWREADDVLGSLILGVVLVFAVIVVKLIMDVVNGDASLL